MAAVFLVGPFLIVAPNTQWVRLVLALVFGFACVLFARTWRDSERIFKQNRNLVSACILLLFAGTVYIDYGANLRAWWWLIDDHVIVEMIGADGQYRFADAARNLANHPEVLAGPSANTRFRPAYFILMNVECLAWGANPTLWYAARYFMIVMAAVIFWRLLWGWCGAVWASLITLYVMTFPYWPDIWPRLGPAEAYAVFGLALFAAGFHQLLSVRESRDIGAQIWGGGLLVLGGLIAAGSKENFLPMVPISWILLVVLYRRGALGWPAVLSITAITAWGGWITTMVLRSLLARGTDVYARPVSPSGRITVLISSAGQAAVEHRGALLLMLVYLVIIAASGVVIYRRRRQRALTSFVHVMTWSFVAGTLLAGLIASQVVYYNADIPWPSRYMFPTGLLLVLAGLVTLRGGIASLELAWPTLRRGRVLGSLVVLVLAVLAARTGHGHWRESSLSNQQSTSMFHVWLEHATAEMNAMGDRPVVITCHQAKDYEYVLSLATFLKAMGTQNPTFLDVQIPASPGQSNLHSELISELRQIAVEGGTNFLPRAQLPHDVTPFGISFSGPPMGGSRSLGQITP